MSLWVLASLPLGLLGAWYAWRTLVGRPPRRQTLNAASSLLLVVYFGLTAGLGIFWVAHQDLPVFDPHYLFGYLTLLLVGLHLVLNGPALLRGLRRRPATASVAATEGRERRLAPGTPWRLLLAAALVSGGYWLGWSRGTTEVRLSAAGPGAAHEAEGGVAARARGGHGAGDTARGPQASRPLAQERTIEEGGRALPLSRWAHRRAAHSRSAAVARAPGRAPLPRPPAFEAYPSAATVPLPPPAPLGRPTGELLRETQRAPSSLRPRGATLAELSALLHAAQGITRTDGVPGDRYYKRAAASAGALYPVVVHVLVNRVEGLSAGLYHYGPLAHELRQVPESVAGPDPVEALASATARPALLRAAAATLVLSAVYFKSAWKYGERGYRYSLLDAGHVAANLAAAAAFFLRPALVGRFDDERVAALLGLDLDVQGPLLLVPVGAPSEAPPPPREPAFVSATRALQRGASPPSVRLAAGGTGLRLAPDAAPASAPAPLPPPPPRTSAPPLTLGPAAGDGDALDPVLKRRRSARRFTDGPLPAATLAALLQRAPSSSVEGHGRLRRYLVATRVEGLVPGLYEADAQGALRVLRAGPLGERLHRVALSQELVGRAAAVVILAADTRDLAWPDGSRGYRYAALDAGLYAGRLYLQGVALGLGVSSVGAFYDDELAALLQTDDRHELLLHTVALGLLE